jgi:hypothetical protein
MRIGWLWILLASALPAADVYISTQDITARPGKGNVIATIDMSTGIASKAVTPVDGEGHELQMFDLAMNGKGELYGVDSTQGLWRIDPRTGKCARLAYRLYGGPFNITGMTFHPDTDELYLAGNDEPSVYRLKIETCDGSQCAPLVDMSKPPYPSNTCAGDIEFFQGDLYLAGEFGRLYRLKRDDDGLWYEAGTSEELNLEISTAFVQKGLVTDGETLWVGGDTNEAPFPHYLATVDTERLQFTKPVPITGPFPTLVSGLAAKPVKRPPPAPAAPTARRAPALLSLSPPPGPHD